MSREGEAYFALCPCSKSVGDTLLFNDYSTGPASISLSVSIVNLNLYMQCYFKSPSCLLISTTIDAVSSQMETMSNPSARYCFACFPEVQKMAHFFPALCVSCITFLIAALCSSPPNLTFMLFAKSNGPAVSIILVTSHTNEEYIHTLDFGNLLDVLYAITRLDLNNDEQVVIALDLVFSLCDAKDLVGER